VGQTTKIGSDSFPPPSAIPVGMFTGTRITAVEPVQGSQCDYSTCTIMSCMHIYNIVELFQEHARLRERLHTHTIPNTDLRILSLDQREQRMLIKFSPSVLSSLVGRSSQRFMSCPRCLMAGDRPQPHFSASRGIPNSKVTGG